jgi:hypothetical protein
LQIKIDEITVLDQNRRVCVQRHPDPLPPFAPLTFDQFYNHPRPPPQAAAEAQHERAEAEQQAHHERADAEKVSKQAEQDNITPRPPATLAAEATVGANIVSEAVEDYPCDGCDNTFGTLIGLRAHIGKIHKVTSSPIPQIDGCNDATNEPNYCKVCIPLL